MLELASLNGTVISDDGGEVYQHTHGVLTYKNGPEHCVAGGHLKALTVLYTAAYRKKAIVPIIVYIALTAVFFGGLWLVPYCTKELSASKPLRLLNSCLCYL
jgi:hypothetical protein